MDGESSARGNARGSGYSMVELLCCVAVVALLGGLALPGFNGAWLHARRSEAAVALLRLQLAEEKFYVERGRYATDLPELYGSTGATLAPQNYRLAASSSGADQYWLEATATGPQTGDRPECLRLAVNQRGERSPPGPGCWR
jgi:type IV pilus assembly protein PilE